MRPKSGAFSPHRPRFSTLIVLVVVASPVVVANLSHDEVAPLVEPQLNPSYGWPLHWYSYELKAVSSGAPRQMEPKLVQWSAPRLAGNLTIGFVVFAMLGVACQWLLSRYVPPWYCRPRLGTIIVSTVVGATIVLSNLSPGDLVISGWAFSDIEYGWPFIWRWRNVDNGDQNYSASRLTGNLVVWLVMLAAAWGIYVWMVRRCRPRLRWSLRTMLVAVGLLAAFFAWCAVLRDRAKVQDPLIAAIELRKGGVYLDRWGPKWLDLVGADRFRRRIIGATLWNYGDIGDEELLRRLGPLPDLRYLRLGVTAWTPGLADALGDLGQLRILYISRCYYDRHAEDDERIPDEVLATIDKLDQLEVLGLGHMMIGNDIPACLAALTKLKALSLYIGDFRDKPKLADLEFRARIGKLPLLAHLPALSRLETICLHYGLVREDDVRQLVLLPHLKSLDLSCTFLTDAAWRELASQASLEELVIDDEALAEAPLNSLLAFKRLKTLHLASRHSDESDSGSLLSLDMDGKVFVRARYRRGCRRALKALRQSNPGIVVDKNAPTFAKRCVWGGWRFDEWPQKADRLAPPTGMGRGFY